MKPCRVPPPNWYCTRGAGHDGPCAAWMVQPRPAVKRVTLRRALLIAYAVIALTLATAWACDAQTVAVEVGKVYNIRLGDYVIAAMPSGELTLGRWTFGATAVLHEMKLIERDVFVRYDRPVKRVTLYGTVSRYSYIGGYGFDWAWLTGVRWER